MLDPIELMAQSVQTPDESELQAVKRLAARLIAIENEIEDCEARISDLKKEREEVRIRTLPGIMFELGINSITVDNHSCTLEPMVQASLPKDPEQREKAVAWMVDNGHGGIVKREMKIDLPKGDAITEEVVRDAVRDAAPDVPVATTYNVHHSSYSALIRQLVREGAPIPTDLLGVYVGSIVRVDKD